MNSKKSHTSTGSYNFQIQHTTPKIKVKHFKRKALKTYILRDITCKLKS